MTPPEKHRAAQSCCKITGSFGTIPQDDLHKRKHETRIFSSKRAGLLLQFVIVVGDHLVIQQKIIIVLVHLRKNVRQRFVHDVDDLFALEQLAVLLNGEVAVKLV